MLYCEFIRVKISPQVQILEVGLNKFSFDI